MLHHLATFHRPVGAVSTAVRRDDGVSVVEVTPHLGREAVNERAAATTIQLALWQLFAEFRILVLGQSLEARPLSVN